MVGHLHCKGANYCKHMSICSRVTANNCFNLLFILLMGGRCKIQFTCRVNMNENNWLLRRVSLMYIWSHLLLTFWEFTQSDATFLYHSPNFSDLHYVNSCITSHLTCMLFSLILWNNSLLLSSSYSSEQISKVPDRRWVCEWSAAFGWPSNVGLRLFHTNLWK